MGALMLSAPEMRLALCCFPKIYTMQGSAMQLQLLQLPWAEWFAPRFDAC